MCAQQENPTTQKRKEPHLSFPRPVHHPVVVQNATVLHCPRLPCGSCCPQTNDGANHSHGLTVGHPRAEIRQVDYGTAIGMYRCAARNLRMRGEIGTELATSSCCWRLAVHRIQRTRTLGFLLEEEGKLREQQSPRPCLSCAAPPVSQIRRWRLLEIICLRLV